MAVMHGDEAVSVRARGLVKHFPGADAPALDGVDLDVRPGWITGLVGPDGAGKTTLMRCMAGLLAPDGGELQVLGMDAATVPDRVQARLGYMPQRFGLYEDLSVGQNLSLYADLRGLDPADRVATFRRLLDFTGLAAFTDRLAGRLSGGMKQKLGLACALMTEPELLVLDEPAVGVDPISRRELWAMVERLAGDGVAVVWSTAYLDEAEACDDVLMLDRGHSVYHGPPSGLTARAEGRVFHVTGAGDKRRLLSRILELDGVVDGVLQGSALRAVVRETGREELVQAVADDGARVQPVPPRLEDAYVDALVGDGHGVSGRSGLAAAMREAGQGYQGRTDVGPVIETRGLTKRFGDFVAAGDVDLSVQRGEVFGLLGPNGAGKSTTFRMLCGLSRPSGGTARVAGHDLARASAGARSRIGYMAQKFSLYGNLSVAQNLSFFARAYGLTGDAGVQALARMMDVFELAPRMDQEAGDLPLGFKQRLALACAVMHQPEILFLDEPTSGVDPRTRREFWSHINGLVGEGVTVMVTTHFMEEAEYCDRIAVMHAGRVIATDTPDGLKAAAATDSTPHPTLEEAFIELVRRVSPTDREAA